MSGPLVEDPVLVLLDGLALLHLLLPVVGLDRRRVGVLLILQNEYASVHMFICSKYVITENKAINIILIKRVTYRTSSISER